MGKKHSILILKRSRPPTERDVRRENEESLKNRKNLVILIKWLMKSIISYFPILRRLPMAKILFKTRCRKIICKDIRRRDSVIYSTKPCLSTLIYLPYRYQIVGTVMAQGFQIRHQCPQMEQVSSTLTMNPLNLGNVLCLPMHRMIQLSFEGLLQVN